MMFEGKFSEVEIAMRQALESQKSREDLIKSTTPCRDAQGAGLYLGLDPVHLTVLAAKSE